MQSYQLHILLKESAKIQIGKLGSFNFSKGKYIYTGSAKKNIEARINRHKSKTKKLHWNIDFLLNNKNTEIFKIKRSSLEECQLNQQTEGKIIIAGFGSSDCKNKCISHLKYLR